MPPRHPIKSTICPPAPSKLAERPIRSSQSATSEKPKIGRPREKLVSKTSTPLFGTRLRLQPLRGQANGQSEEKSTSRPREILKRSTNALSAARPVMPESYLVSLDKLPDGATIAIARCNREAVVFEGRTSSEARAKAKACVENWKLGLDVFGGTIAERRIR